MCRTDQGEPGEEQDVDATDAVFTSLLEDSAEELYEQAPCGYLSTLMDGTIAKINSTLLGWLGLERSRVVGRMRFTDLLTVGGKLYHETHFAPLLQMKGEVSGIALDIKGAVGRMPVLVTSKVKTSEDGEPLLIRTTVFDARDRRAYEMELLRGRQVAEEARRQAEATRARLQETLAVLQQSLLPSELPVVPGLEAASYYHTASPDLLGGDFYDLFPLDTGRWAFFLGDVCGKGPQAAAVTSLARYTLRAAAMHDPDPVTVLTTLNSVLHERYASGEGHYCTVIFGVLQPANDGHVGVHLASGGHPSALIQRADGSADYLPTPGGLLVGVLPQAPFTAARTDLLPGDTLLLYTDGLTEARTGPKRELYGDDALRAFTAARTPAGPQALITALSGLLASFGDGLDDDTALLALGVPASLPTTASEDLTT
ncbi:MULTISPECIES: SpoIIE family protein phosphatase [Streptomyces]|uniref:Histidine kinase n=2 Tax=Streptomyces TaxID=1883 RepID=A0A652L750_9ACTN|nr:MULTISPECIES: SpoIIE family protein phosphatase [unclassified Streptomyces]MDX3327494.1 SpoIIE family protein phosphatase [Streptomyces sp. ME02-6979-3A]MDX3432917.1 SpoIIE family protein phosphatase [Streptomyces sp. ME01-18a]MDX3685828.1 SpoIIE family protein phosphatase [Streptomyces sp. AK04-4c]TXS31902.1 histidine kinase [Streptomyces sp. gb1(2016)]